MLEEVAGQEQANTVKLVAGGLMAMKLLIDRADDSRRIVTLGLAFHRSDDLGRVVTRRAEPQRVRPAITGAVKPDGPARTVDGEPFVGFVTGDFGAGHALALLFPAMSRLVLTRAGRP